MSMTISQVRGALHFSAYPRSGSNLENLIIDHLDTVAELRAIDGKMASFIVLCAQGYNLTECAFHLGLNVSSMSRRMKTLRRRYYAEVA